MTDAAPQGKWEKLTEEHCYRVDGRRRGFIRRGRTTADGPVLLQAQAGSAQHVQIYAISWWRLEDSAEHRAKKWVEGQVEVIDWRDDG